MTTYHDDRLIDQARDPGDVNPADDYTGMVRHQLADWPVPTVQEPDLDTLEEWLWDDGGCEASDGCWIEFDGVCPHGHPSWLLRMGLI